MVFCRQCQKKVEDCEHFVFPIQARRLRVVDAKIETIAYVEDKRVLEIAFKTGQVWQLSPVPPGIFAELQNSTISSFLKFIAQRYNPAPVKQGIHAIAIPESEPCPDCKSAMTQSHRTGSAIDKFVRVQWSCACCKKSEWKTYGTGPERERRGKWR